MSISCSRKNCTAAAEFAPKLCIPATGWAIDLHQPISAVINLPLCKKHAREFKPKHFITEEFRNAVRAAAAGKCPPDFSRAFITKVSLDSKEYSDSLGEK